MQGSFTLRHAGGHGERLSGLLPAVVTPLTAGGDGVDEEAIAPLVDFYCDAGVDGLFVGGTTGEGLLLSPSERMTLARRFVEAGNGRLPVVVQAGAQTTRETVALVEHAAAHGAAAVAVVGPPYFKLDDLALEEHFATAAQSCAPLPFFLYEIRERTGYALPLRVVHALRERAENLVGIKVSDPVLEEVRSYLLPGFDVFVGAEKLIQAAMADGAVGAVSGVAAALPRAVARVLAEDQPLGDWVAGLRAGFSRFPFHAALKLALGAQGVPIEPSVRAPLRGLTDKEAGSLRAWLDAGVLGATAG